MTFGKTIKTLPLLASAVLFSGIASAAQPWVSDDTGTQGAGGHQLEFSLTQKGEHNSDESQRTRTLGGVYTYGLTETLDVFAGSGYSRIRKPSTSSNVNGFGNPTIGAKWRFFESDESGTSVAIKPEIALPVNVSRERDGLGTGKTSGNLTAILTQEVPFGEVHVNAGLGRDRFRQNDENPATSYKRFSIAPVWEVTEAWKLALDTGFESARANSHTVRTHFVEVGAIYSPNKSLDFAVGAIRAIDNDSPKTTTNTLTAGVTWRF